jgi:hypothetical protein
MLSSGAVRAFSLVSALFLTACGGGESPAPLHAPDIQTGEQAPVPPAIGPFIAMARVEPCSDIRNRLFVLDDRMVIWDRVGNCRDNGSSLVLYGANVEAVLCSSVDTIAGLVTSCKDEAHRPLFDILRKNLDRPDLGLGGAHTLKIVDFVPRDGT